MIDRDLKNLEITEAKAIGRQLEGSEKYSFSGMGWSTERFQEGGISSGTVAVAEAK